MSKNIKTVFSAMLIFCLCFLCFPFPARAAENIAQRGAGYSAVLYDNSNGLSTSEANSIAQSEEGFIWIGGYSGLTRYDGEDFYRYDSSTGVSSVVSVFVDSKNRLWIGTNDSGVAMMQDNEMVFYDQNEGLKSSSIRSIEEDPAGNILIATTRGMAYVDPQDTLHVINDHQINDEYIYELICGKNGVVYGCTNNGAFFTMENLRVTAFYHSTDLGHGEINTVYPDPNDENYVYIGMHNNTILRANIRKGLNDITEYSVAPLTNVNSIRFYENRLWVCTDQGIGYFGENGEFMQLLNLPMTNSIDKMMRDQEGNLWFTSSRQGVMKIVENRFVDISNLAKLDPMVINSTYMNEDGLYLATDHGLYVIDREFEGVQLQNAATQLLKGVRIRCIMEDRAGVLWFCTYSDHALVSYDPKTDRCTEYTVNEGLASNRVRSIRQLADGRLAVATNAGLNILENGKITATYNGEQGISNLEILCTEEDDDGSILLGSDGGGIFRIEANRVTRIGLADGLKSEVILRMKKDPFDHSFWIIASNSISHLLRDGSIQTVRNFPYANNFDLYFTDDGMVWILSSNGVYMVNRNDLIADEEIAYTLYDTHSGLPYVATANSFSHLAPDGTLYISGSGGVCSVNILDEKEKTEQIRLAVPYLTVDDQYVPVKGETVHVPKNARRVNVHAYAFTYLLINPRLSYQLEGFDCEPKTVTRQDLGTPSYTNLKAGTYHFRFSVIDSMTGKTAQTYTLTIVKDAAFYEYTWFRVLCVLLALLLTAGIVALFYRQKTKKLLRKQEEHKEMINEMTAAFAKCVDMKDAYTNGHSFRVAKYTAMLAKELGKPSEEIDRIYNIALLHDIGKISIPDQILNKPGRLTDEEFAVMKGHSSNGRDILKEIAIAPELALGAGYHHEKYDGTGYPNGLKGDEIPEIAQIIAVADTFDAMYSTRPYRRQLPLEDVVNEIKRVSGTQLSPRVVEAFLKLAERGAFDSAKESDQKENTDG